MYFCIPLTGVESYLTWGVFQGTWLYKYEIQIHGVNVQKHTAFWKTALILLNDCMFQSNLRHTPEKGKIEKTLLKEF